MPRVYERKFDHDLARRRYAAGESLRAIAEACGVTPAAVARVVDPVRRRKMEARSKAWQMSGVCRDCGKKGIARHANRCQHCAAIKRATTARPGELLCFGCREWKPDHAFPHNRIEIGLARRGRHNLCRACSTAARRDYRERHKIPCTKCGEPRLAPNETSGRRRGLKDSGLCRPCYIKSITKPKKAAA